MTNWTICPLCMILCSFVVFIFIFLFLFFSSLNVNSLFFSFSTINEAWLEKWFYCSLLWLAIAWGRIKWIHYSRCFTLCSFVSYIHGTCLYIFPSCNHQNLKKNTRNTAFLSALFMRFIKNNLQVSSIFAWFIYRRKKCIWLRFLWYLREYIWIKSHLKN
jgi:hypothetical protein